MKRLRSIYFTAMAAILSLSACQSDNDEIGQGGGQTAQGDKVKVTFRISPAGNKSATRSDWRDANAKDRDEEMMNVWTVIMVEDTSNKIVEVLSCKPTVNGVSTNNNDREWDEVLERELTPGTVYRFYSFANIGAAKLQSLLGLTGDIIPTPTTNDVVVSSTPTTDIYLYKSANDAGNQAGTTGVIVPTEINVSLGANGKVYTDLTATDDPFGFGSQGIPMSNVQSYTVPDNDATYDLIVIRMFAKIELPIYNETSTDMTLKSITISDVTLNPTASENTIKLLPTLTAHNTMDPTHKDLKQDIATLPNTKQAGAYTYTVPTGQQSITKNTTATPAQTIAFYINESAKSSVTPSNADGLYYLTVELADNDYRYALISQKGQTTDDDDAWDYIARNDYRVIPIVLDDYKLELVPYDFPAIGVLPSSVKTFDADKHIYEIDFHDYGHFHLVPKVTHNNGTETITFTTTAPTGTYTATSWGLVGDAWGQSWFAYTAYPGTSDNVYNNATASPAFYVNTTLAYPAVDASENGGIPVMDTSTTWNGFSPYIFGKIAPHASGVGNQVYHEFKVNLYVSGESTPRQLTYRFYMVLKDDHPAARRASARGCQHQ